MNLFKTVRTGIKPRAVMEQAGIRFNRSNMCCCPFHPDKNPSMKVKSDDEKYFCFGCGASGDAIDFVAEHNGLTLRDAALKIAIDFGLTETELRFPDKIRKRDLSEMKQLLKERDAYHDYLAIYLAALLEWKCRCAPKTQNDEWHPLFVESLQRTDQTRYLVELLEDSMESDIRSIVTFMRKEMTKINERLQRLVAEGFTAGE